MQRLMLLLAILATTTLTLSAQNIVGTWKTVDDETGAAKSHIKIYEKDGVYYGKVVDILTDRKDARCESCDGKLKNKPVLGMVIIDGLRKQDKYWKDGEILDPVSGKTYRLSMWFESGKSDDLKVRGKHWTGLYRTQTWYRVK